MEKKKINKEKKKRNNLPLLMALCAVIGTSCSVLALTQNFSLDNLFNKSSSDIIINPETVINCEYIPATTTSVFQATNGDIEVSTDGHVQVPLFYSSLEKVTTSEYVGIISYKVKFNSNGYAGIDIPVCPASNSIKSVEFLLHKDNNNIRVESMFSSHHNDDEEYSRGCLTEESAIAYSKYIENINTDDFVNVDIYWMKHGSTTRFKIKVNGNLVEWSDFVEKPYYYGTSTTEYYYFKVNGTYLDYNVSGNTFPVAPIYLDFYDVQATVKDIVINN